MVNLMHALNSIQNLKVERGDS